MVTPIGISLWKILSAAVHSSDWQWQLGWILSVDRALLSLRFKNDANDPFPSVQCHKLRLWMNGWMHASLLSSATTRQKKKIFQSYPWNDMLSKFTHMHLTLKWRPKASWASPSKHCGCIFLVVIRNFMENVKLPTWYGKSPWKMWNSSVSSKVLLTAHAWRIAWKTCMQLRDPYSRAGENNTGSGGCGLCWGQLVSAPGLSEGSRPLREVGRKGKKENTEASEKMNQVYRRKSRSS